jgi:hypothetical protein
VFDEKFVAEVLNEDGTVYDHCYTWETGQSMSLAGYSVRAIADDGHMTKEAAQKLYDAERERYRDCFGVTD